MTLAPVLCRELKFFDDLIGWTLANATLADAAGLVQNMTPEATLVPASYCEPGFNDMIATRTYRLSSD